MLHYTIYETTNIINDKVYTGVHQTKNMNDNYLGSGILLKKSIKKYGRDNFEKKIIFQAKSEDIMYWVERMIVDEEYIGREDTYNLIPGGIGGIGKKISDEQKIQVGNFHRGKKLSQIAKDRLSNSISGEKNYQTRIINVYNKNNNLVYSSKGSFKLFCKNKNLPGAMLAYSIRNNGIRIYKNNIDNKFHNWYAKVASAAEDT